MPQPSADRNLLIGVLALQMDFIDRDQLVAAMHAWIRDKSRPLDAIFLEQEAIDSDTGALLVALVDKHLEKHGGSAEQSLASVSSLGSTKDALEKLGDAAVRASLVRVGKNQQDEDPYATRRRLRLHELMSTVVKPQLTARRPAAYVPDLSRELGATTNVVDERLPWHILHGVVMHSAVFAVIGRFKYLAPTDIAHKENRDDVRMMQSRRSARFRPKTLKLSLIQRRRKWQDLQCDTTL